MLTSNDANFLRVGDHILNLGWITFVDLRYTWQVEEWTHAAEWPHERIGPRRIVPRTGVKLNFVDGKSVIVEDLPDAPATWLREYLLSEVYDPSARPASLSLQAEILAGLPADLRKYAQGV